MNDVIIEIDGSVGRIRLNRPAALNAVTAAMFRTIAETLEGWRDDSRVEAVLVQGRGKAFSAGGDIREVRDAALRRDYAHNEMLYRYEYGIDATISAYPKPYVALVDGYCMGGGLGLVMHGSHRIVSENAVLAMPETAIGFFPDVGATYLFPRLPGALGLYLGLTGYRVGAGDALECGLADLFVPQRAFAEVERRIVDEPRALDSIFREYGSSPPPSTLQRHRAEIARCFSQESVLGIVHALEREDTPWAQETLAVLRRMSPTALVLTFAMFRRGATMTLPECLEMELRVATQRNRSPEFLEGVRAMVIDKDRKPAWSPSAIESVDVEAIHRLVDDATRPEVALPD